MKVPYRHGHRVIDAIAEPVGNNGCRPQGKARSAVNPLKSFLAGRPAKSAQAQRGGAEAKCQNENAEPACPMRRVEPDASPRNANEGTRYHKRRQDRAPYPLEEEDPPCLRDEPFQPRIYGRTAGRG